MNSPRLLAVVAALVPLVAHAAQTPLVTKGPVVSGVTRTDAWVAWETAHHQGTGTQCSLDAVTGSPNTAVPTLTLAPAARSVTRFPDAECSRVHRVHLVGLAAGTRYTFVLDQPNVDGTRAAGAFETAPASTSASFQFVVYGDNRDAPNFQASTRADHQAVSSGIVAREGAAKFLLHTGDLALNMPAVSGDDRGYTEFFDVERTLLAAKPVFAVVGNHETIDTTEYDALVDAAMLAGSAHPYYSSFEWGNVHVALLDTFEGPAQLDKLGANAPAVSAAQLSWLDADLAAANKAGRMIFLVGHQGAYSHSGDASAHGGSPDVVNKVRPLALKYGALAMFAGHDHYYQRGHEGCLDYFVVGGGGAPMYEPDARAAGVAAAAKVTSYVVVSVDGAKNTATLTAKSTGGSTIDTFRLVRANGATCSVPTLPAGKRTKADGVTAADAPDTLDTVAPGGCGCGSAPLAGLASVVGLALGARRSRRSRA